MLAHDGEVRGWAWHSEVALILVVIKHDSRPKISLVLCASTFQQSDRASCEALKLYRVKREFGGTVCRKVNFGKLDIVTFYGALKTKYL